MPYQKEVIALLRELGQGDDFWVIVGGGPVTREYAADIGSNGWAPDAASAVRLCDEMIASGTTPANTAFIGKGAE